MTELKPCPFCGSDGNDLDFRFVYATKFTKSFLFVGCRKCGGMMVDTNMDHCLNDVKKAWNRRTKDDTTGEGTYRECNPSHPDRYGCRSVGGGDRGGMHEKADTAEA